MPRPQPAFLIVGDPIHKAKRVKRCVDSLNFKLKQFYLLPYSPQSDPGESVWAHVERKVVRQWVESAEDIKRLAFGALRSI